MNTHKAARSRAGRSTPVCAKASIASLCTSSADALSPALGQQVGGNQGGFVAALLANAEDQCEGSRVGERFRSGERISSCLAESTMNPVISKRFAKRQQMQWTKRGAHLLLQPRTRTLYGTLQSLFER